MAGEKDALFKLHGDFVAVVELFLSFESKLRSVISGYLTTCS